MLYAHAVSFGLNRNTGGRKSLLQSGEMKPENISAIDKVQKEKNNQQGGGWGEFLREMLD